MPILYADAFQNDWAQHATDIIQCNDQKIFAAAAVSNVDLCLPSLN
jgi:hypothetical protein